MGSRGQENPQNAEVVTQKPDLDVDHPSQHQDLVPDQRGAY
jgi:hypothetical protein